MVYFTILPNIIISDYSVFDRKNLFLKEKNIKYIFNCSSIDHFPSIKDHQTNIYHINISDSLSIQSVQKIIDLLEILYCKLIPVIICGPIDNQKNITLIALFIISNLKIPWQKSISIISTKLNNAFRPTIIYSGLLEQYTKYKLYSS